MQLNTIFLAGREKKCQNKAHRMRGRGLLKSERDGEKEKKQPKRLMKATLFPPTDMEPEDMSQSHTVNPSNHRLSLPLHDLVFVKVPRQAE